jgi:ribosome-binding protein aMBF1 (putative translation factor)
MKADPPAGSTEAEPAAFGRALRAARLERGLTQLELSHRIGAHVATVCRWERGHSIPEAWWMDALRDTLGLPPPGDQDR